jgi:hypothetical protein
MELPQIRPMVLAQAKAAFDHPKWIFEPKIHPTWTFEGADAQRTFCGEAGLILMKGPLLKYKLS